MYPFLVPPSPAPPFRPLLAEHAGTEAGTDTQAVLIWAKDEACASWSFRAEHVSESWRGQAVRAAARERAPSRLCGCWPPRDGRMFASCFVGPAKLSKAREQLSGWHTAGRRSAWGEVVRRCRAAEARTGLNIAQTAVDEGPSQCVRHVRWERQRAAGGSGWWVAVRRSCDHEAY